MSTLKFCPKCGGKLDSDSKFCNKCGADIRKRKELVESPTPKEKKKSIKEYAKKVEYATFIYRFFAFLVDSIIILIVNSIIWRNFRFYNFRTRPFTILVPRWVLLLNSLTGWIIGFFYFWILESFNEGQTLGKLILKLRTVDESSFKVVSKKNHAINNIIKSSPFFIIDFIIGIFANYSAPEKRLRYTQNLSKTVVIKVK